MTAISLRDYFAAAALQGLAARKRADDFVPADDSDDMDAASMTHAERAAYIAYEMADAMLAERNK